MEMATACSWHIQNKFYVNKKELYPCHHLIWRWYLVMNHIKCQAVMAQVLHGNFAMSEWIPTVQKEKKKENTNYTGTHLEFETNLHICFSVSSVPVLCWLMGDAYFKICYFLDIKSLMLYIHWCNILRF